MQILLVMIIIGLIVPAVLGVLAIALKLITSIMTHGDDE